MLDNRILDLIDRSKVGSESLARLTEVLATAPSHDIASTLPQLEARRQVVAFRLLGKDRAMEVFDQLAHTVQSELVGAMATPEVVSLFEDLDPDDRVRLFEELSAKVAKRNVAGLSKEAGQSVTTLMGCPAESAGRAKSPRYLALRETLRRGHAVDKVRDAGLRADELRAVFVNDAERHYRGFVLIPDLLRAEPHAAVGDVADGADVAVAVDTRAQRRGRPCSVCVATGGHDLRRRAGTCWAGHRRPGSVRPVGAHGLHRGRRRHHARVRLVLPVRVRCAEPRRRRRTVLPQPRCDAGGCGPRAGDPAFTARVEPPRGWTQRAPTNSSRTRVMSDPSEPSDSNRISSPVRLS